MYYNWKVYTTNS